MRFPWQHREDEARVAAERAKKEYEKTVAKRARVERIAGEVRREREANGWTQAIIDLTGGNQ